MWKAILMSISRFLTTLNTSFFFPQDRKDIQADKSHTETDPAQCGAGSLQQALAISNTLAKN